VANNARSGVLLGAGTAAAPASVAPAAGASLPRSTGHAKAASSAANMAKVAQPAAALQPAATIAPTGSPVTTMPSPGPQKISPPSAGCPSRARRAMHQLAVPRNTRALATPASNRKAGHTPGTGSASRAVNSAVATSPPRASAALPGTRRGARRASQGSAMNNRAPAR